MVKEQTPTFDRMHALEERLRSGADHAIGRTMSKGQKKTFKKCSGNHSTSQNLPSPEEASGGRARRRNTKRREKRGQRARRALRMDAPNSVCTGPGDEQAVAGLDVLRSPRAEPSENEERRPRRRPLQRHQPARYRRDGAGAVSVGFFSDEPLSAPTCARSSSSSASRR